MTDQLPVLADRAHALSLDTVSSLRTFRLSAESRLAVYGDVGTSPLYAVRLSLVNFGDMSEHAILGVLSFIVWAQISVVTMKHVLVVMRADNRGEGGLLALTALVLPTTSSQGGPYF